MKGPTNMKLYIDGNSRIIFEEELLVIEFESIQEAADLINTMDGKFPLVGTSFTPQEAAERFGAITSWVLMNKGIEVSA